MFVREPNSARWEGKMNARITISLSSAAFSITSLELKSPIAILTLGWAAVILPAFSSFLTKAVTDRSGNSFTRLFSTDPPIYPDAPVLYTSPSTISSSPEVWRKGTNSHKHLCWRHVDFERLLLEYLPLYYPFNGRAGESGSL